MIIDKNVLIEFLNDSIILHYIIQLKFLIRHDWRERKENTAAGDILLYRD